MANFTVNVPVYVQNDPKRYLDANDKFRAITFLRQEKDTAVFRVVAEDKHMAAVRANYYILSIDRSRKFVVRRGEGKVASWFQCNQQTGDMEESTPD